MADAYAAVHLYYEKEINQEEVARRMEVSRPTVSKLLERVMNSAGKPHRNVNVSVCSVLRRSPVFRISKPFLSKFITASKRGKRGRDSTRISVRRPVQRDHDLELSHGLVGFTGGGGCSGAWKSASAREILLAQGALELLKECLPTLPQERYMGLGWGRAVLAFVEALERTDVFLGGTAEVVPLIGGSGQSLKIFQINEIARRAAAALRVSARLLPALELVKNESLRAALFAEVSVRLVAEAWRKLDVAVVGIGRKLDQTYLAEYLQEETLQDESLVRSSVSNVCSHYFAAGGEALEEEHDARLIAASRDEFRRIPLAVGVAGGPEKIAGIVGAARAGLIKALVTDEDTANGCLEITDVA